MTSTPETKTSGPTCASCGALAKPGLPRCWLCGEEQPITADIVEEHWYQTSDGQTNPWLLHGGIWLSVVLCALILFGLMLGENKYYAIGFAIMIAPALSIALGGAALGRALGKPWHPLVKGAIGAAIATVLLPVAMVVALFIACTDLCTGKL